jgi:hypothetical protein
MDALSIHVEHVMAEVISLRHASSSATVHSLANRAEQHWRQARAGGLADVERCAELVQAERLAVAAMAAAHAHGAIAAPTGAADAGPAPR